MFVLLLLKQEMEVGMSSEQIEVELRRALNLNQDPPSLNNSRSATTSLPSDVQPAHISSPRVASSPQSAVSSASPTSAADTIPTASSSSSSVNNEAGTGRRRKPRRSKQYSPRQLPHDGLHVPVSAGNGKNVSESRKSTLPVKPGSPKLVSSHTTNAASGDSTSASSVLSAGITSVSSSNAVMGMNVSSNARAARTVSEQRGGRASRGRGRAKSTSISAGPGQSVQRPKNDDRVLDVHSTDAALSGQLPPTDSNASVKLAPLPTANNLSNEAPAKLAQNTVKQSENKHEKGKTLCTLILLVVGYRPLANNKI